MSKVNEFVLQFFVILDFCALKNLMFCGVVSIYDPHGEEIDFIVC